MSETEQLNKLKRKRGIVRASVTKVITKLESELAKQEINVDEIELLIEHLNEKTEKLKIADSELENLLEIDDLEDNLNGVEEYTEKITTCRFLTKRKINELKNDQHKGSEHTSSDRRSEIKPATNTVKLPKLVIPKFYGELNEWLAFWNSYQSSIHENLSLSRVDKFNYLKSYLGGTALNTIDGLALTDNNYDAAVGLLKDRFGDNNILINAHIEQLLKLTPLKNSHDTGNFRKLFDHVQKNLRSLQTLGVTSDKYSAILTPLLLKSLPADLVLEYNKSVTGNYDLENLLNFLSQQLSAREKSFSITPKHFPNRESYKYSTTDKHCIDVANRPPALKFSHPTSTELITTETKKKPINCIFCNGLHASAECDIKSLSHQEKMNKCKQFGYCFKCVKPNHRKLDCRSRISCKLCNSGNHIALMCFKGNFKSENKQNDERRAGNDLESNLWNRINGNVYLQTIIVKASKNNTDYFLRAIIDTASSRTFLTRYAAKKLELKCIGSESILHGLFGGSEQRLNHKRYLIDLRDINDRFNYTLNVMDQEKICAAVPKLEDPQIIKELNDHGIFLSDLTDDENLCLFEKDPKEIHLLIGADYAGKIYTGEIKTLSGGLVAMNTKFGWSILGAAERRPVDRDEILLSLHVNSVKISDLWSLDSLGITEPALSQTKRENEESALKFFRETITRDSEGRYEVALPWVENHPEIPDNLVMAKNRLKGCIKTLKDKNYLNEYENVLHEWAEENVIETVDSYEGKEGCHYLPHRAVIKEDSTTRVRPVFDASAKGRNFISLNDCLQKGPNFLELLPNLLNKFRIGKYGVISDIKRAFLQIALRPQDRDNLRFLWWEGGNPENLKVYRHRRVVFGVNASPFLLTATINYHLDSVAEHHRTTALKLKESMHVDNCVTSVDSAEELNTFISESKVIMNEAKFDLRGWHHNELPYQNPESDLPSDKRDDIVSVLGLNWNLRKDTLLLDLKDEPKLSPNKRTVLSMLHKLFDPIGFISPVTIIPKQILQDCWRQKINWDEILPPDLAKKFIRWVTQLNQLKEIEIPRKIPTLDQNVTLHVFCDASSIAYATCVFLRRSYGNTVDCQLLQSRARIAPVKPITIPRMEVLSCTIGARLAKTIKEDLNLENIKTYYWSDSMNALYWIKREENWATFILNRVNEIRKISNPNDWHHIPGKHNPADLPSRGCCPKELRRSKWWLGPEWMYQPPEEWPSTSEGSFDPDIVNTERRKTVISASNAIPLSNDDLFEHISNYHKILKIVCWMFRFVKNVKFAPPQRTQGPIKLEEMKQAEMIVCRYIQRQSFRDSNDKSIRNLQPITDSKGIIRLKSRILQRADNENFRLPILLPADHPLVMKLIRAEHEDMGHAGTQFLMSRLRERYWILKSRKTIRKVVRSCVHCRKYDAPAGEAPQSALPEDHR